MYVGRVPPITVRPRSMMGLELETPLRDLLCDIAVRISTDPAFSDALADLAQWMDRCAEEDTVANAERLQYALDEVMTPLVQDGSTRAYLPLYVAREMAAAMDSARGPVRLAL